MYCIPCCFFFFFQAEDGIRDLIVTGVQTCALPILFFGQGPSSKVSTTSPSRRKSWLLKCSNPKPGPPVVSISTTRLIPRALGLPAHEDTASTGATAGGGASAVITAEARPSVGAAWAGKD